MSPPRIAVVGIGCVYPDAASPESLWENVLARRRAFRRIPDERLPAADYFSPDRAAADRTYSLRAAVIDGWQFDRVAYRVAGSSYRTADLAHWLALDVASMALADAGFIDGEGLPRETTGVLVGNSLTGEFSRASVMRLRWPYVRRVVDADLEREGWSRERRAAFLERLEESYKAPFEPVGEESLAGGLSNTIAGRICNTFDLHGGGYTVDGACSSSLLAIAHGADALVSFDLDVALAGGVDLSLDPFELVGFAKTGALATDDMRVYDARSGGFWPGEGCGVVVLMRLEDALRQGRRIYATIAGWGISSDGAGGITRPEPEGQRLALERAYRRAGYGPDAVAYVEGHGTGTAIGDATELRVLSDARRAAGAERPATLGSIKANIGHTKAAAGAAGFIKTVKAIEAALIPPTTGVTTPHPLLTEPERARVLRVADDGEAWDERTRRAAVSSMGFGGINVHITLESDAPGRSPSPRTRVLLDSSQDVELFLVGARDAARLDERLGALEAIAPRLSLSELTDLAGTLAAESAPAPIRAALLARTPDELRERISTLRGWIEAGVESRLDAPGGVFLGRATRPPRIGFLFPGQGSPSHRGGGALRRRFSIARSLYAATDALVPEGDDVFTAVAQPAIVRASLAASRVLESLGVRAVSGAGHSLGELTALAWAGALDDVAMVETAAARGNVMGSLRGPAGAMASLGLDVEAARRIIEEATGVVVAGMNGPDNTVVSGPREAVDHVVARAQATGTRATRLDVSHAFHSPLMLPAAHALDRHLATRAFDEPRREVVSTVTGAPLARDTDLRGLLMRQLIEPVRFADAIAHLASHDLIIEVGPGHVLSGLAAKALGVPCIATDAGGRSLAGLLSAVGAAWAAGAPIERAALASDRFARRFDPERRPQFFESPCEHVPAPDAAAGSLPLPPAATFAASPAPPAGEEMTAQVAGETAGARGGEVPDVAAIVRELVAARAELPVEAIADDHHVLEDLHLNSISVGQVVVEAARRVGAPPPVAPNEHASSTVGEIAEAVAALRATSSGTSGDGRGNGPGDGPGAQTTYSGDAAAVTTGGSDTRASVPPERTPGIGSWVRPFGVRWVPRHLRRDVANGEATRGGSWTVVAERDPLAIYLGRAVSSWSGGGVLLIVPDGEVGDPDAERRLARRLVETARAIREEGATQLVVVERRMRGASFARVVRRELPHVSTLVVGVPDASVVSAAYVAAEVSAFPGGHVHASYDAEGRRRVPVLERLDDARGVDGPLLGADDVVLVTGGGKGIAAEVALALAERHGVPLALVGRSDPATDPVLAETLARVAAAGVRHLYVPADVGSADDVQRAVDHVVRTLGPVTAVVHAAGVNEPRPLDALDDSAFEATIVPKLDGARHVLAAVEERALKLFLTFGSIIGRIGMEGQAEYALANDLLAAFTERVAERLPACRCHCLEWSAWSGVGMAERMGRIDALVRQGVACISPDAGVRAMLDLLDRREAPVSVVLAGRFGAPDTIELATDDLPLGRFLERTVLHVPRVELIVEADLSPETDPYLDDHVVGGERLLPAVLGLEAMAQVACALTARSDLSGFDDVELLRPVRVSGDRATIRIAALVRDDGGVEVSIRSSETDHQVEHFRARCRFGAGEAVSSREGARAPAFDLGSGGDGERSAAGWSGDAPVDAHPGSRLDPDRDLYGSLLFQSGPFHRIERYRSLSARRVAARMAPDGHHLWFGGFLPGEFVLGDPGVRDACLHAIQACVPHARILPVGVGSIRVGALPSDAPIEVRACEVRREGKTFVYDMELLDADGATLETWRDLELRAVGPQKPGAWTSALLEPYVERRLEEIFDDGGVVVRLTEGDPSRETGSMLARAATSAPAVHRRPDGKPVVPGGLHVSISHAGGIVVAMASSRPIGCDVEPVAHRDAATWRDLLGTRHDLALTLAETLAESADAACTRVWTAMEALTKIGAPPGAPLVLHTDLGDGWVVLSGGDCRIATCVLVRRDPKEPLAVAVALGNAP